MHVGNEKILITTYILIYFSFHLMKNERTLSKSRRCVDIKIHSNLDIANVFEKT